MQRWIFLSGMMGSGKTSVGHALARRLGAPFIDLDAAVVARAGRSIPDIFAHEGEDAFRRMEAEEVARLVAERSPAVLALGGGTVTHRETRRALLECGLLVTLRAPADELARRLEGTTGRPLLERGEAAHILRGLLEQRTEAYAECHAAIETAGRSVEEVAALVEELAADAPIAVPLGLRTYRVHVGRGRMAELPARLAAVTTGAAILVTDENVGPRWASPLAAALRDRGVTQVTLPPGEVHKTLASVERIWDAALEAGIDRSAVVVAVGGGVVGDLAGFAASTLLRGLALVQVPTSLLAMVDASVGGKTGFDRPQGKNLIGTFHQPRFVLCDVDALSTLPDAELRSGFAEVVKSAWLDSEDAVRAIEEDTPALVRRDPDALERAVRMAVRLKARVVSSDEHESGRRMVLNLGHTLGHAIEAARGYRDVRHGEAVALGMVAAFRVARALGRREASEHEARMRSLLSRLGLPVTPEDALDERTLGFVASDKKRAGGKVRFVVPGAPGEVEIVPLAPDELLRAVRA
ncbi:MAG TPA: 3-dehydroquinate synthase [Sandaracinaceae bacterium]